MSDKPVTNIDPEYYRFSDGVELISITENLTGNGAQAVQYITRSTRLDGANKSKDLETQIQDLEKAMWFIKRESDRLKAKKPKPIKTFEGSSLNDGNWKRVNLT